MTDDHIPTMGQQAEAELRTAQQAVEWLGRLKLEAQQLDQRGMALNQFIRSNPKFKELPTRDQELLVFQMSLMAQYFGVLNERIYRAENPEMAASKDTQDAVEASGALLTGGDNDDIRERAPL